MSDDQAERERMAQLDAALVADEAELGIRDEVHRTAARRIHHAVAALDAPGARRARNYFARLASELAVVGDDDVAAVADAVARYTTALQVYQYGVGRLDALGLALGDT